MHAHTDEPTTSAVAHLYLLTTMALFGAAFTSSKLVVGQLHHSVAAALRFGGGALILVLVLCLRPGTATFSWRELWRAGSVGLVGVFAYNVFYFWGISLAPAIDGSIIVPVLSPVLTTLALTCTRREAISPVRISGLVLGVVGAGVFFAGVGGPTGSTRLAGDLVFLAGAGCWAAYSIISKKVLRDMDPLRATTYATVVGAVALTLLAIPAASETNWPSLTTTTWFNLAFLAVGATAVAYLFYFRGLRSISPVSATLVMFAVPVFGTAFSALVLGESVGMIQVHGAMIMIVGALLAAGNGLLVRRRRTSPVVSSRSPD
jgi:drug/metabolite transporter (DMT)-like permease